MWFCVYISSHCRVISRKAISSTTNRTYYSPLRENFSKNWDSLPRPMWALRRSRRFQRFSSLWSMKKTAIFCVVRKSTITFTRKLKNSFCSQIKVRNRHFIQWLFSDCIEPLSCHLQKSNLLDNEQNILQSFKRKLLKELGIQSRHFIQWLFSDCIAFFVGSILESFVSKEGLSLAKVMIALAGLCAKVLSLIVGFYLLVLQGLPLFLLVFHFTRVHISPKTKIGFDLISNSPWSAEYGRCSANDSWVFFIITSSV